MTTRRVGRHGEVGPAEEVLQPIETRQRRRCHPAQPDDQRSECTASRSHTDFISTCFMFATSASFSSVFTPLQPGFHQTLSIHKQLVGGHVCFSTKTCSRRIHSSSSSRWVSLNDGRRVSTSSHSTAMKPKYSRYGSGHFVLVTSFVTRFYSMK